MAVSVWAWGVAGHPPLVTVVPSQVITRGFKQANKVWYLKKNLYLNEYYAFLNKLYQELFAYF